MTKQSFLLTFESTIDCSAFTMNFCLFFLHLIFFWKQLLGSFLVLHLLYNKSEVLVRSGQILHHQYDIFAVVPQTPIPCETTVVVVLQILDCFLSYKRNENCNLLFCRMLYFPPPPLFLDQTRSPWPNCGSKGQNKKNWRPAAGFGLI